MHAYDKRRNINDICVLINLCSCFFQTQPIISMSIPALVFPYHSQIESQKLLSLLNECNILLPEINNVVANYAISRNKTTNTCLYTKRKKKSIVTLTLFECEQLFNCSILIWPDLDRRNDFFFDD
jgi:hypothetical protein